MYFLTSDLTDLTDVCYTARLQGNQGHQWLKLTLMLAELAARCLTGLSRLTRRTMGGGGAIYGLGLFLETAFV